MPIIWALEGHTLSLIEKYIKLINDSSAHVSGLVLLIPPVFVACMFSPDVEYTTQRIVINVICVMIFSVHTIIGFYALIKKEFETVLNFLLMPLGMVCFVIYLGLK